MPKFVANLDMRKNSILNIRIHPLTSAPPAPVPGQIYYNLTDELYYQYKNSTTAWVPIGGGTIAFGANSGIVTTTAGGVTTANINPDGVTLEVVSNQVRVKDLGIGSAKLADNAVITAKILAAAVTFAKFQDMPTMSVFGRVIGGTGVGTAITINNNNLMTGASSTTLATDASIKAYIDSRISSIGSLIGSWDASTQTTFPGGAGVYKGNYWYVVGSGIVLGQKFNPGDVIIANKDTPSTTVAADWIFLESNRDQATETALGLLMLATSAEVNTGTDALKAVTAATLSARTATTARTGLIALATSAEGIAGVEATKAITSAVLTAVLNSRITGLKFATAVGDGTATSFPINHNFNTKDVDITVIEVATGETVYADVTRPTVNQANVAFGSAPTLNEYRILVA